MTGLVHWLGMGGYALYLWSAYGLVTLALALTVLALKLQATRTRKLLQQWFKRQSL